MERIERRAVVAAVLAGAVAAGTAGCGGDSGGQAAGRARTPQESLRAAAPGADVAFRYTVADADSTVEGVSAPAARSGYLRVVPRPARGEKLTVTMSFLSADQRLWTRIALSEKVPGFTLPTSWMRVDRSKVTRTELLSGFAGDPTGATALLGHTADVTGGAGRYAGTVDVTAVPEVAVAPAATVAALGARAAALPFTAEVDDAHRLTRLEISVPAAGRAPAYRRVATFADYGSATVPEPPAAAVDAPAAVYDVLND
ncbi:MAG TPA: hypothetical protein VFY17_08515 [Pilimelia sp.]|nr:hypothetical protein [Pilimelia sp.]